MMRLEKCELLKSKGYTYDKETGKIFGVKGKEIVGKNNKGYIRIDIGYKPRGSLYGHHFAYYMVYGNVDFIELDHKNRIKDDNRICNLRISNNTQQNQNRNSKGYSWNKTDKVWCSSIKINGIKKHLGCFKKEEEARQAYLSAKLKYHPDFIHSNQ